MLNAHTTPSVFSDRTRDTDPYAPECTCSYCGSLSPKRLLELLQHPETKVECSDWKYGWPHKFYIEHPNAKAGQPCKVGSCIIPKSRERSESDLRHYTNWKETADHWEGECIQPAPTESLHKFYTVHLLEATDEEFDEITKYLTLHTNIMLSRGEDGSMSFTKIGNEDPQ